MNLMNKIDKIEKDIKKLKEEIKYNKNKDKSTTINDIKVGEQFIYRGHNYTKLNNNNYCIIDDYCRSFMKCIFDPTSNDYKESLVRQYINSNRFIENLEIDVNDLKLCYDNRDYITLISKDEYKHYQSNIGYYGGWWMSRSSSSADDGYFCGISVVGITDASIVYDTGGVRVCFILKPNTLVTRK